MALPASPEVIDGFLDLLVEAVARELEASEMKTAGEAHDQAGGDSVQGEINSGDDTTVRAPS